MGEELSSKLEQLLLDDPFRRSEQSLKVESQNPCVIDTCHYAALVMQSIDERLGPPVGERSLYDQRFLEMFSSFRLHHPDLLHAALRTLVYADEIVIPNIDVDPGELYRGRERVVTFGNGGYYVQQSEECRNYLLQLAPLVLKHPLSVHIALSFDAYRDCVERLLGFQEYPNLRTHAELAFRVVTASVILQELRTVMMNARESGIPAVTSALDQWPRSQALPDQESFVILQLYFDSAIHSPSPRNIDEALSLRSHPRISQWREVMRQWTAQLSKGEIKKEKISEAIQEANSYIEGANFIKSLIPSWSIYVTVPVATLNFIFGLPAVGASLLIIQGIKFFGQLVWASVTAKEPMKYGWYLASDNWGSEQ